MMVPNCLPLPEQLCRVLHNWFLSLRQVSLRVLLREIQGSRAQVILKEFRHCVVALVLMMPVCFAPEQALETPSAFWRQGRD